MSRSYKKPWRTQGYGSASRRWSKRYANRTVRRSADVPDGKAYRKYYDPWMICDWKWLYDPYPWCYMGGKEPELVEPEPLYRWNRK